MVVVGVMVVVRMMVVVGYSDGGGDGGGGGVIGFYRSVSHDGYIRAKHDSCGIVGVMAVVGWVGRGGRRN